MSPLIQTAVFSICDVESQVKGERRHCEVVAPRGSVDPGNLSYLVPIRTPHLDGRRGAKAASFDYPWRPRGQGRAERAISSAHKTGLQAQRGWVFRSLVSHRIPAAPHRRLQRKPLEGTDISHPSPETTCDL
ncbi:hypothetical protein DPEC_G00124890 [Dallia pectoralis]|uniref:Uncharacterized protein n=1 Tax=Dallia pectoralis TaxID=75939 RepID=A0ACC2GR23_DALPE|nr:hypothetical protein DPEC_G00124890 [Dallia pectoralis]